jgi:branched-chain amino acid transport system ATP-binding protein
MTIEVRNLTVHYGDSRVLDGVNLVLPDSGLTALIGANGAGKTTLLRTLMGLVPLTGGEILVDGRSIGGLPAEQRSTLGLAMVPEGRRLFQGLTVHENLRMGAFSRRDSAAVARDLDRVYQHFPALIPLQRQLAGTLSGGQQQMCAVGRGLMARPRYLLVDEMSLGLSPIVTEELARTLMRIHEVDGMSILVVEQDVELALDITSFGYVMETSRVVLEGPSTELRTNSKIQEAYLGL